MNKKGNISDVLWFLGIFFMAVVTLIVLTYANSDFNDVIQNDSSISSDVKTPLNDFNNRMPKAMDSGMVLAFLSAHIGIIFLGLLLRSHPVLFPILFLALIVLTLVAGFISNAYDEIASETSLQTFADQYPMTSWILDNYLMVTLVMGFLDIITFIGFSSYIGGGGI